MGMSIETDQEALVSRLAIVSRGVATKGPLQVLTGVHIAAAPEGVELRATDTQLSLRVRLPASVDRPGDLVVPGRLLLDVVRNLPAGTVRLAEDAAGGGRMALAAGSAAFSLYGFPSGEFPHMPDTAGDPGRLVPKDLLVETAARVARSASRDETRPILRGVAWSFAGTTMTMVATDSYRLAVSEVELPEGGGGPDGDAIVPSRALGELARIAPLVPGDTVEVRLRDAHALLRVGDREEGPDDVWLMTRLIDGTFPNHRQLLPEAYEHEIVVDRMELSEVVRRVALLAVRNNAVRLHFSEGELRIRAQTADLGDASDALPVPFSGDPFEIGFNPEFLRDGLDVIDAPQVVLRLISPLRPALLVPAEGPDFRYLIMPIRPTG